MKRGTPEHPKMKALAEILGIDLTYAVGIMERLWHFTAKYAPRGDIGKFTDKAIAEAVGWKRPTGERGVTPECKLRDALVIARWLDSDPIVRLVVHDWKDHCDESVKKYLSRHNLDIVATSSACLSLAPAIANAIAPAFPLPVPSPLPESPVHLESSDTVGRVNGKSKSQYDEELADRLRVAREHGFTQEQTDMLIRGLRKPH